MDTILVTGGAGFIGYHLSKRLLKDGYNVVGYDNMNDYYDPKLKEDRVRDLEESGQDYRFIKGDLADKDMVFHLFEEIKPAIVVNLAAQAGVRYSIDHPDSYIQSNIVGFFNIPGSLPPLSGKASSFCIEFFDLRKSGKSSILGQ